MEETVRIDFQIGVGNLMHHVRLVQKEWKGEPHRIYNDELWMFSPSEDLKTFVPSWRAQVDLFEIASKRRDRPIMTLTTGTVTVIKGEARPMVLYSMSEPDAVDFENLLKIMMCGCPHKKNWVALPHVFAGSDPRFEATEDLEAMSLIRMIVGHDVEVPEDMRDRVQAARDNPPTWRQMIVRGAV